MDLQTFSERLTEFVGDEKEMRPLLCCGNPLTCTVALVGINPRSTTPFWKFWNSETGMNRKAWLDAYRASHDGTVSRSRAAIERFVPQVAARVIELNAYVAQSNRIADLEPERRKTDVLRFVLDAVRPKVIVCAGVRARAAVEAIGANWNPAIVEAKHFIYWGRENEVELARRVNALLCTIGGDMDPDASFTGPSFGSVI
jgi:hypothetical protein